MTHELIVGMTMSGKTTLAKAKVSAFRGRGIKSCVLDPLCDPDWCADYQTDDPDAFLRVMYKSRSCALFVDESGAAIGRYAGEMAKVATQSRHMGHKAHFLTQRAAQLDRTVRDQCSLLWLFRVGKYDADCLAEEFGYPELKNAPSLKQGQCWRVSRFEKPVLYDIFN